MITTHARTLIPLAIAGVVLATLPAAEAAGPPSANGQGVLSNGARHFSFSARTGADGVTTGNAVLRNTSFNGDDGKAYYAQIDITCMKSFGDGSATFGGLVRRTNDANLFGAVFFTVKDNGEPGKGVDQISRAFFWDDDPSTVGDDQACKLVGPADFPLETIEAGNVQVRG